MTLYPLRFEPLFKANRWGGNRLPTFLNREAPADISPIGEAWVLSDVDGSESRVANGSLAGRTLRAVLALHREALVGAAPTPHGKFPLLLKFIDAKEELSVQVHPNDEQAARIGPGLFGKTEAWVVLESCPDTSQIYAGFGEGVTEHAFRSALGDKTTPGTLHTFKPKPGDCVFLEAGTVHAIGANILIFEVQQTSDITYRLYDWDRVDKDGAPRELHIDKGLACADFGRGPCHPVRPAVEARAGGTREGLVNCPYFTLERHTGQMPFPVGARGQCRVLVCARGSGEIEWSGDPVALAPGDTVLLPAELGEAVCNPKGEIVLLECGLGRSG